MTHKKYDIEYDSDINFDSKSLYFNPKNFELYYYVVDEYLPAFNLKCREHPNFQGCQIAVGAMK
jgi:hypothetical protein